MSVEFAVHKKRAIGLAALLALALAPSGAWAQGATSTVALGSYGFQESSNEGPSSIEGSDAGSVSRRLDLAGERLIILCLFRADQSSARPALAALAKLKKDYNGRLLVAALSPDSSRSVAAACRGLSLEYPVLSSPRASELLGLKGTPAFLVIAPGGKTVARRIGSFDWSSPKARRFVDELLAAHPPRGAEDKPAAAAAPAQAASAPRVEVNYLSALEMAVVSELNLARTDPKGYALYLRDYRALIHGGVYERPGQIGIQLQEGTRAVDEAIAFLEKHAPLGALAPSRGMSRAAKLQALDQGKSGATGHSGSDGSSPFDRMNRFGKWGTTAGENVAYGPDDAREIVIQLVVDDGVSSRGHRANVFNPAFKLVGVGLGSHPRYGSVCVQDFAGDYEEKN